MSDKAPLKCRKCGKILSPSSKGIMKTYSEATGKLLMKVKILFCTKCRIEYPVFMPIPINANK